MAIENEIKSIFIRNIKGYNNSGKTISFNSNGQGLLPNKLNILVAPNGFGKSSFAIAIDSTGNGRKIHLDKKFFFKEDDSLEVEVKISCKLNNIERELVTNKSTNEINKEFDVFTINSHLDSKGTRGRFRGANSDLIIKDIELMQVPNTVKSLDYTISDIKAYLTEKGFETLNKREIDTYIIDLIETNKIYNFIQLLEKYSKTRAYSRLLTNYNECEDLEQVDINYFVAILEIYKPDKDKFKQYIDYQQYKLKHDLAKKLLENIKTFDSFDLKLKKEGDKLLVKLPKATVISNGQRDILVFLANLLKAEFNFLTSRKKYGILVIDEVFDYLDDANLLIAQYFLVNFIQNVSKTDKKLFTILLTHLAPNNFNHFYFNRKKVKKVFFLTEKPNVNTDVLKFLKKREEIKKTDRESFDVMSKFLHYRTENILLNINGLSVTFIDRDSFVIILKDEYKKYYNKQDYCPYSVAIYLRLCVEEKVYNLLANDALKDDYLNKNSTMDKFSFAEENGIEIDEKYYLLSAVYNDMAHNDNEILYFKLNNQVIRNLIIAVIGEN